MMQKTKCLLLAILVSLSLTYARAQKLTQPEQQLFCFGRLVSISVDKQLYVSDTSDYFYIHVSVKNISKKDIGIDLSNSWYVLYPNQWQFSDTTMRQVIDERQIVPAEMNAKKTAEIDKKFADNALKKLAPGQSFDYYTEFNSTKPNQADMGKSKYLIVAIDGQMFFTDGRNCEQIKCNGDMNVDRELVIKCQPTWPKITEKQKIFHRK